MFIPLGVRIGLSVPWIAWAVPTTDLSWREILWVRPSGNPVQSKIEFRAKSPSKGWVQFTLGPLGRAEIDANLISALRLNEVPFHD